METWSVVFTSPVNDIFHLLNNSHLEIADVKANKSNKPIRTPCGNVQQVLRARK